MNTEVYTPKETGITPEMILSRIDAIIKEAENVRIAIDKLGYVELDYDGEDLEYMAQIEGKRVSSILDVIEAREQTNRELIASLNKLIDKMG